ncbi:reverse transcriptase domain, reverse transcriptase zinc-binding domain protein, partial [Tanacetum coccineum]
MQGGRGRGDPFFGMGGDPFASFGGMPSLFGGKDPFDDPFFHQPMAGMLQPNPFGHVESSLLGGSPFGDRSWVEDFLAMQGVRSCVEVHLGQAYWVQVVFLSWMHINLEAMSTCNPCQILLGVELLKNKTLTMKTMNNKLGIEWMMVGLPDNPMLSSHLTEVEDGLDDVVSDNQSAFISGYSISENILLTQELMHNYHLNRGTPSCAFKIDIQKAYDMVIRNLFLVLNSLNVPLLNIDQEDTWHWKTNNGVLKSFFVREVWHTVRQRADEVDWFHLVWSKYAIPRHDIHQWLVMRKRLKTQDRLRQWDVGVNVDLNLLRCPLISPKWVDDMGWLLQDECSNCKAHAHVEDLECYFEWNR